MPFGSGAPQSVRLVAALATAALALGTATATASDDSPFVLEAVAEGVWVARQPEANRFNDANVALIETDRELVVIDAPADLETARAILALVPTLSPKPVRYLANSHFHSDHTRTNYLFQDAHPEIEILGHKSLVEDIPNRAAPDLDQEIALYRREIPAAETRLAEGIDRQGAELDQTGKELLAGQIERAKNRLEGLDEVRWVVPTVAIEGTLTLHRPTGDIVLRTAEAHTRGDLLVHLPAAGVLVTGDVVDDLPFGGHGYPSAWIEVLRELEALEWRVLIPGHGRVREGKDHLIAVRELLEAIVAQARVAATRHAEIEPAEAWFLASDTFGRLRAAWTRAEDGSPDPIAERAFDDFVPATFERAFLEASGQALE